MSLLRKILAPVAALTIAAGSIASPALSQVANAAELTPQDLQEGATLSKISPITDPITKDSPKWRQKVEGNSRVLQLNAYSDSMGRNIPLAVITPADNSEPRPTIYMLNGAGGAEQNMDWISSAPIVDFYADKNVNVVIPMAGAFSYYTDWVDDSLNTPYLKGPQKWETFLLKELPGAIEPYLKANNQRGIAGYSMSATSSLVLAQHAQGFYDVAGSFSGCAATSSLLPWQYVKLTVNRGGAEPEQMWGPMGGEYNRYNDGLIHAERLRGTQLYISNASGLAGEMDMPGYYISRGVDALAASSGAATLIIEGGAIEAATNACTHDLKAKLDRAGIAADYNLRPTGTHSWNYWIKDLNESWPTFARAFNM